MRESYCHYVNRELLEHEFFVQPVLNQSAEGAGGLGIIRDNKVGESE